MRARGGAGGGAARTVPDEQPGGVRTVVIRRVAVVRIVIFVDIVPSVVRVSRRAVPQMPGEIGMIVCRAAVEVSDEDPRAVVALRPGGGRPDRSEVPGLGKRRFRRAARRGSVPIDRGSRGVPAREGVRFEKPTASEPETIS